MLGAFAEWLRLTDPPQEVISLLHKHSLLNFALTSITDINLS